MEPFREPPVSLGEAGFHAQTHPPQNAPEPPRPPEPADFGLDGLDLLRLGNFMARRLAPPHLRADAASEFIVGCYKAAAKVDPARNPKPYIIYGGRCAVSSFLWHEYHPLHTRRIHLASLDAPRGGHGGDPVTLLDVLADGRTLPPELHLLDADFRHVARRALDDALRRLPPRRAEIVRERFLRGFTARQVAAHLGVSVQRVYQATDSALKDLRRHLALHHPELASLCGAADSEPRAAEAP